MNSGRMIMAGAGCRRAALVLGLCVLGACSGGGTGGGSGSSSGGSSSGSAPATVSVMPNQTISGFPHQIDYYVPSNATAAVIFLHGGGGHKEGLAYDLGIKSDSTSADYDVSPDGADWLLSQQVMAVFPQGQAVQGTAAYTWSNYVMISGQDDVAFLQALVAAIKANPALPKVDKIYLAGHSNGGMMANRMWCESPQTFDAYGALAGPPSIHLDPTATASASDHPCQPSTVKPYIGIVGDADTVLETGGNLGNSVWVLNPVLHTNSVSWVDSTPSVLNDLLFHATRVSMRCGGTPGAPVTAGRLTSYSDCGGSIQFVLVSQARVNLKLDGGDHCLLDPTGPCRTTLAGSTGLDYKTALMDFFRQF